MAERLAADLRITHSSTNASSDGKSDSNADHDVKQRGTGTLGKVMDVIDAVAASDEAPRFTDLLHQLEQPRGTLHRNLANLLEEQIIVLNPQTHAYHLGPRLLQLANKAWQGNEFRTIAEPHLKWLNDQARETVHLAVLQDDQVVYLDKFEAQQSLRMHSQIGRSSPVFCTGVGKAILSGLTEADFEALMPLIRFEKFTENTITDVAGLRADREISRKRGYTIDEEEHEVGIRCVAAPIVTDNGTVLGAISVTAPSYRVDDAAFEQWKEWVCQTSQDIATDANLRLGPRRYSTSA